jgi:polyhydroxyalkanoate synthesis regulator phasin
MAIDTLKFARRLQEARVPPKQAEAEADAIQEALETATATKSDIVELKGEITTLRMELMGKIATLRWTMGFDLALTAAVVGKLLLVH